MSPKISALLFILISAPSEASFVYWNFGTGAGSSQYWTYGTGPGSEYYWKYDSKPGSEYFWQYGRKAGSEYFWQNGKTSGSSYFWEYSKEPGSRYYWNHGKGPGSRYYWEHGEGESFGPIYTALCKAGKINIEPCALMVDSPMHAPAPSELLNELINPSTCDENGNPVINQKNKLNSKPNSR